MKKKLDTIHKPVALIFQVHNGQLVEAILSCLVEIPDGGTFPREVWLKDASDEFRNHANEMIQQAIKLIEE